jgi:hypothetical protein
MLQRTPIRATGAAQMDQMALVLLAGEAYTYYVGFSALSPPA